MTAYADIVVEIFRLSVPLGIGSVSFNTADFITVGPIVASTPLLRFLTISSNILISSSQTSGKLYTR